MTAQVVVVPVYNKHNVPIWFKNRMRKKLLSSVLPYPQSVTFTFIIFFKKCHLEKSGKKLMLFIFETSGYNGQCDRLCLVWKIDFCFSSRNFAHFELKFGALCYNNKRSRTHKVMFTWTLKGNLHFCNGVLPSQVRQA